LDKDLSRKKIGREIAFHIDETPNSSVVYDYNKYDKIKKNTDNISCITSVDGTFIVGRKSGKVHKYTIPHISLEATVQLRCYPQIIESNCNATMLAIIDNNGILSFFDLETRSGPGSGSLDFEKKDVWNVMWSEDLPN
jgi:WD repeat-containing protein 35